MGISALGMFSLIFGIQEAERLEWSWVVWALIGAGVALLAAFAAWQRTTRGDPLVPPSLFGDRNYALASAAIFAVGFAASTYIIPWMIYIQSVQGYSPTRAALLILPAGLVSGALAPFVGKLTNTRSPKPFAIAGLTVTAVSIVATALITTPEIDPRWLLAISVVNGVGNSMMWGPLSMIATRNLDPRLAGAGSSVYNTVRQVGAVIGSASIAAVMTSQLNRQSGIADAMSNATLLPAVVLLGGAAVACALAPTKSWSDAS